MRRRHSSEEAEDQEHKIYKPRNKLNVTLYNRTQVPQISIPVSKAVSEGDAGPREGENETALLGLALGDWNGSSWCEDGCLGAWNEN